MSLHFEDSVAYRAEVGKHCTFDLALIKAFSCHAFPFDPTQRAVRFVTENVTSAPNFHFFDLGVWDTEQKRGKFRAPRLTSVVNLRDTSEYFWAGFKRLSTLMRKLARDKLDRLKLDIEGAEFVVLDSILLDGSSVRVLSVVFDQPSHNGRVWRLVRKLGRHAYSLVRTYNDNNTFVNAGLIRAS